MEEKFISFETVGNKSCKDLNNLFFHGENRITQNDITLD